MKHNATERKIIKNLWKYEKNIEKWKKNYFYNLEILWIFLKNY